MGVSKPARLLGALRTAFCRKPTDTEAIDGGKYSVVDTTVPKSIRCRRITSFFCTFSTVAYLDSPEAPPAGIYRLEARRTGNSADCRYSFRPRDDSCTDTIFTADRSFLDDLSGIVGKRKLVQFNGMHTSVSGLPDFYGAELRICYASGESISASDNEDCFLPPAALTDFVRAFANRGAIPENQER
ncbi:MAG: hypothetical protein E7452_10640 [Ruminococcaceae bacterium]|nr:hypothetical protein [Oscillospiraceae bacterium]